jgi:hypothetical protein
MDRSKGLLAVVIVALVAGCPGGDSGGPTVEEERAALAAALSGWAWTSCRADAGDGLRETIAFSDGAFEVRAWRHGGNPACGGLPVLEDQDTGSGAFVLGDPVDVPDPDGSGTVRAFEVDVTRGATHFYTIAWVDASASPAPVLYFGDDSAPNDGSTPALRPTELQVDQPRARGAVPAASPDQLPGAYGVCRNDGLGDFTEVIAWEGSTFASRVYHHATTGGSCGGSGQLVPTRAGGSFDGTFTLGATADARLGAATVRVTEVDGTIAGDPSPSLLSILWVDSWATTRTLYMGDDSGLPPETRPTALQSRPRYLMPAPEPFPGVLQGSWAACTFEETKYALEVFTFTGTELTIHVYDAPVDDPTCAAASAVPALTLSDAFTLGATATATLGELSVVATHLDLALLGLHALLYVDPYATTPTLYVTDSKVPDSTVLQDYKPRYRVAPPPSPTLLDAFDGTTLSGAKWWPNGLASAGVAGGEGVLGVAMDAMEPFGTNGAQYGSGVNVAVNPTTTRVTTLRASLHVPSGAVALTGTGTQARAGIRLLYSPPSKRLVFPKANEDLLILEVGLVDLGGGLKAYRQINHCDDGSCASNSATGITLSDPAWADGPGATNVLKIADAAYDTVYTVEVGLAEGEGTAGVFHWSIAGGVFGAGASGTADPAGYLGSDPGWTGLSLAGTGASATFSGAALNVRVSDRSAGGGGGGRAEGRFDDVQVGTNGGAAAPWDDFSGTGGSSGPTEFSPGRWLNGGARAISLSGGSLAMTQHLTSVGSAASVPNTLPLANPASVDALQANLRLAAASVPTGGAGNSVVAGLRGRFFNDGTGTVDGSAKGDVMGILTLRAVTNDVGWSIIRCTSDNCGGTVETVATGVLAGSPLDGLPHFLSLGWNAATGRMTFACDGASVVVDPADLANPTPVSAARAARAPLRDLYTLVSVPATAGEVASLDLRVNDVYTAP